MIQGIVPFARAFLAGIFWVTCTLISGARADSFKIAWEAPGVFFGVDTASFTRDGREWITGSSTGIKVWDGRSLQLLRTLSAPRYGDNKIALSPDDRWLVSAFSSSSDGRMEILVRERESGEIARRFFAGIRLLYAMTFSADGRSLMLLGANSVDVHDVETGLIIHRWDPPNSDGAFEAFFAAEPHASGDFFLANSQTVLRLQVHGTEPKVVWRQTNAAYPISAPKGSPFVAAKLSDQFGLLAVSDGTISKVFPTTQGPPDALALSESGSQLASLWNRGRLHVRLTSGEPTSPPTLDLPGLESTATTLTWSPDSSRVLAGHLLGASVWDLNNPGPSRNITALPSVARGMDVSTNGWLAVSTGSGHTAILRADRGELVALHKPNLVGGPLAMFPNGLRYVTRGSNQPVELFDRETGAVVGQVPLPPNFFATGLKISPNSRRLAVLSATTDLILFSTETWRPIATLPLDSGDFWRDANFSPNGEFLAAVNSDDQLILFSADDGRKIQSLSSIDIRPRFLKFVSQGQRVRAMDPEGQVVEWELVTGVNHRLGKINVNSPAGVFWMPDDATVLVSESGSGISWWDIRDGHQIARDTSSRMGWWMRELQAAHDGRSIIGARFDGVVAALAAPIQIRRFERRGDEYLLDVVGMNPPFQLERSPARQIDWQTFGFPFRNSTGVQADKHGSWLFRVRSATP